MSKTIYSEKFSQQEQERITQEFREALQKKDSTVSPILPFTDAIASTRLGKKWCENFDFFPEYKGQTDLGKRCLRRGGVCHLAVLGNTITATVCDAEPCTVTITFPRASKEHIGLMQQEIKKARLSVVNFRKGNLPEELIETLCSPGYGLLPPLRSIQTNCSCGKGSPCLHVFAALFGMGRMLDTNPLLAFSLRGIESWELYEAKGANRKALPAEQGPGTDAKAGSRPVQTPGLDTSAREASKHPVHEPTISKVPLGRETFEMEPRAKHSAGSSFISGVFSSHASNEVDFASAIQDLNESFFDNAFMEDEDNNEPDAHKADMEHLIESLGGDQDMALVVHRMQTVLDAYEMSRLANSFGKISLSPRLQRQFDDKMSRLSIPEMVLYGARTMTLEQLEQLDEKGVEDLCATGMAILLYRQVIEVAEGKPPKEKKAAWDTVPDSDIDVLSKFRFRTRQHPDDPYQKFCLEMYRDAQEEFSDPKEYKRIDRMFAKVLASTDLTRKFFFFFNREFPGPLISLLGVARLEQMEYPQDKIREEDIIVAGTAVAAPLVLAKVLGEDTPGIGNAPLYSAPVLKKSLPKGKSGKGRKDARKTRGAAKATDAAAKAQPAKTSDAAAKAQPAKATDATAKVQPAKATDAAAKAQPAKATDAAAKAQPAKATDATAKVQPAKAGETAAKTQPKEERAAPAKTTANDKAEQVLESTPLPFDAKNPTGEGLRALFRLSGTSEEGFAWHLGVGMPTITRWLKVEGPLNVRSASLQKICKYQTKILKKLGRG